VAVRVPEHVRSAVELAGEVMVAGVGNEVRPHIDRIEGLLHGVPMALEQGVRNREVISKHDHVCCTRCEGHSGVSPAEGFEQTRDGLDFEGSRRVTASRFHSVFQEDHVRLDERCRLVIILDRLASIVESAFDTFFAKDVGGRRVVIQYSVHRIEPIEQLASR